MRILLVLLFVGLFETFEAASADNGGIIEVPFNVLRESGGLPLDTAHPKLLIIEDKAALDEMWKRAGSARGIPMRAPEIDFRATTLIVFFPARGYPGGSDCDPVYLSHVTATPEQRILHFGYLVRKATALEGACSCASFASQRFIIASMPKSTKPVAYVVEPEPHQGCMGR